jgi:hypothetical protein
MTASPAGSAVPAGTGGPSGAGGPSGTGGPSGARKPGRPPSRAELAERDRFAALTSASLGSVRSSAQTWRNGLAAFITLVTTGFVVVGRSVTTALSPGWRAAVTALVIGGLAVAVGGLWLAIAAEAGTDSRKWTLQGIREEYGTLAAYEIAVASRGARQLALGRVAVAVALVLLLAGVAAIWWAPTAAPSPAAYLRVSQGSRTWCGTLKSADRGSVRLAVAGQARAAAIPMARVSNLAVTAKCQ